MMCECIKYIHILSNKIPQLSLYYKFYTVYTEFCKV